MSLLMNCSFQQPATSIMEGIIDFHHDIMFYLIVIVVCVSWCLFAVIARFGLFFYLNFSSSDLKVEEVLDSRRGSLVLKNVTHNTLIEVVWTIIPVFVLISIALPSFALLYSIDEVIDPVLTVKIIGHQWFWSYEYGDDTCYYGFFDSYMIPETDLESGQLRLLEVDSRLWLPINTHIRLLITSADVLHSWSVPALGIKIDCVPGRLNQISLFIKRPGVFYGQCSELCGVNHGFMPIVIQAVELEEFSLWLNKLSTSEETVEQHFWRAFSEVYFSETIKPEHTALINKYYAPENPLNPTHSMNPLNPTVFIYPLSGALEDKPAIIASSPTETKSINGR